MEPPTSPGSRRSSVRILPIPGAFLGSELYNRSGRHSIGDAGEEMYALHPEEHSTLQGMHNHGGIPSTDGAHTATDPIDSIKMQFHHHNSHRPPTPPNHDGDSAHTLRHIAASKSRRQSRFIGDSGAQADAFLASMAAAEIEGIYMGYPKGNSESGSRGQVFNIPQQHQPHLHQQRRSYCSSTASADDGGMPYSSSSSLAHHTMLGGGGWPVNDPGNYNSGGAHGHGYGYGSETPLSAAMHPHNSINPSCRSSSTSENNHQASDSGHAANHPRAPLMMAGLDTRNLRSPGGNEPSSLHQSPTQCSPYGSPRLETSPMSRGGIGCFSGGDAGLDNSTSQLSMPLSYEELMLDPNNHTGGNHPSRGRRSYATRTSMMHSNLESGPGRPLSVSDMGGCALSGPHLSSLSQPRDDSLLEFMSSNITKPAASTQQQQPLLSRNKHLMT